MSEEKKLKKKLHKSDFFLIGHFLQILPIVFYINTTDLVKKSTSIDMSEKKKHSNTNVSFLVRHILSSSEESWTKEYNKCCLKRKQSNVDEGAVQKPHLGVILYE